jgi:signal transduction histidine kinase
VIFASAGRLSAGGAGIIQLADDMRRAPVYLCGVHLRLSDPSHRDWLLAGLLVVLSDLQIWLAGGAGHHAWRGALFATAVSAAVGCRRQYPATVGIGAQALMWLDFNFWHDLTAGAWTVAWFCALYGLAVWASPRRFAAGTAIVVATDLGLVPFSDQGGGLRVAVPFAAGTLAVMLIIRRIVRHRDRRAELAERERDVAAREAVVEERARIARELHDAIAHNVSMMVVQAGAERRVLGTSSSATKEVLETIEQIGRGALTEMRRLVGMLRADAPDMLAPQPRLADLPTLMAQVGAAGLPVDFRVDGDSRELPVGIELSAYRIVQEALTNALKHGGQAQAAVHLRYGADTLELEITDDGGGALVQVPGGGQGLVGMRERVSLYGGVFDAGARPGGGFAVRVLLPLI